MILGPALASQKWNIYPMPYDTAKHIQCMKCSIIEGMFC